MSGPTAEAPRPLGANDADGLNLFVPSYSYCSIRYRLMNTLIITQHTARDIIVEGSVNF